MHYCRAPGLHCSKDGFPLSSICVNNLSALRLSPQHSFESRQPLQQYLLGERAGALNLRPGTYDPQYITHGADSPALSPRFLVYKLSETSEVPLLQKVSC
jgi:hypothetical protein